MSHSREFSHLRVIMRTLKFVPAGQKCRGLGTLEAAGSV